MKNFTKALIRGVITGLIVGFAVGFVMKEFMSPAFNLEPDWSTVIIGIIAAIGAATIIELNKHSKEKTK